jgi:uncharacterized protein (DUF433 family)
MLSVIHEHIDITDDTCGGKPRITGTRIRIQDVVVWHEQMGLSPDEIVSQYPTLTLGDVHAALTYYYDHFDRIRQDIQDSARQVEALRKTTHSKLQEKLTQTR